MAPLIPLLDPRFQIHLMDFPGHGRAAFTGGFDTSSFADALLQFLAGEQVGPMDLFGYSMGGYVALEAARRAPDLIRSVATLGTKFAWTPEAARKESRFLDPETIRAKVPYFAELLERRHQALAWPELLARTGAMMAALGEAPLLDAVTLAGITQPVRILVGDQDGTVTVEESLVASRAIPAGQLEVIPLTPHPLEKVPLPRLAGSLTDFFLDGAA
jgi:pimeloyl-ACP methyl ester carboxylesterase